MRQSIFIERRHRLGHSCTKDPGINLSTFGAEHPLARLGIPDLALELHMSVTSRTANLHIIQQFSRALQARGLQ